MFANSLFLTNTVPKKYTLAHKFNARLFTGMNYFEKMI